MIRWWLLTPLLVGCVRGGFSGGQSPAAEGLRAEGPRADVVLANRPSSDAPRGDRARLDLPGVDAPRPPLFQDDFSQANLNPAWSLWRVQFALQNGRLVTLPAARVGFNYGHDGNGRSAEVVTHVGDPSWKDYRLSLTVEATGVVPAFNPYAVSSDFRNVAIHVRVKSSNESWNAPAQTRYILSVITRDLSSWKRGDWTLYRYHSYYLPGTGWSANAVGEYLTLKTGTNSAAVDGPNQVVVEVKDASIAFWLNGAKAGEHLDTTVTKADGGASYGPILSGGVGVSFGWESMGWIDDLKVEPL